MTKIELGRAIRQRRKNLNMSLENLSFYTGISVNTLSKIERGETNPTFDILSEIFKYLGLQMKLEVRK